MLAGLAAAAMACGNKTTSSPSPQPAVATGASASSAPVTPPASAAAAEPAPPPAPVCAALDPERAALPPLDTKLVSAPLGSIVDEGNSLGPFYARLARLVRGKAKDHVRIAVYGDSNMTMDFITGAMRRMLQAKFGDGGHGFVALARPWPWYRHFDVKMELGESGWRKIATSTNQVSDGHYGFANIASESTGSGAWAWAANADDSQPIGRSFSKVDVFYLKGPARGSFAIKIDGTKVKDVTTAAPEPQSAFEHFDLPDGPHKIECVVTGGSPVRLYGASLERDTPSILVDSLGTGALNYEQMTHVSPASRDPMLQRRRYDLVVFLLGTNLFAPAYHEGWMAKVIDGMEAAVPSTPILVLSPPDIELKSTDEHSDPRIVKLAAQLGDIAKKHHWAFWDFRAAMGGDRSMIRFAKQGLANWDLVHLTKDGGAIMGQRLAHVLFAGFQGWLGAHAEAGCDDDRDPVWAEKKAPPAGE
jgi:lysophospholipase L1-like esterase